MTRFESRIKKLESTQAPPTGETPDWDNRIRQDRENLKFIHLVGDELAQKILNIQITSESDEPEDLIRETYAGLTPEETETVRAAFRQIEAERGAIQ